MNAVDLIRRASHAYIDLNVRDGQLYAGLGANPPDPNLVAENKEHRGAIIAALDAYATIRILRIETMRRCMPLTPDNLTAADRDEAEGLAADLADSGGLGQFVVDLMDIWDMLCTRDRLIAVWCWETAARQRVGKDAAEDQYHTI